MISDCDADERDDPRFKPKKSVALSGVTAGNTALCTVGRTGNDLHYRGYDILDIAKQVRVRGDRLSADPREAAEPRRARGLQDQAQGLRGLPAAVRTVLEQLPAASHPMDVMRTGVSALGCLVPETGRRTMPPARATSRTGCWRASARCCATGITSRRRPAHRGARPTTTRSAAHFLHLLHGRKPSDAWVRAMHTSLDPVRRARVQRLDLHRAGDRGHRLRHLFLHHRRHRRAARAEARRRQRSRLRDPEPLRRRPMPPKRTSAAAWRARRSSSASAIRSTPCRDPRNQVIKEVSQQLSQARGRHDSCIRGRRADRRR